MCGLLFKRVMWLARLIYGAPEAAEAAEIAMTATRGARTAAAARAAEEAALARARLNAPLLGDTEYAEAFEGGVSESKGEEVAGGGARYMFGANDAREIADYEIALSDWNAAVARGERVGPRPFLSDRTVNLKPPSSAADFRALPPELGPLPDRPLGIWRWKQWYAHPDAAGRTMSQSDIWMLESEYAEQQAGSARGQDPLYKIEDPWWRSRPEYESTWNAPDNIYRNPETGAPSTSNELYARLHQPRGVSLNQTFLDTLMPGSNALDRFAGFFTSMEGGDLVGLGAAGLAAGGAALLGPLYGDSEDVEHWDPVKEWFNPVTGYQGDFFKDPNRNWFANDPRYGPLLYGEQHPGEVAQQVGSTLQGFGSALTGAIAGAYYNATHPGAAAGATLEGLAGTVGGAIANIGKPSEKPPAKTQPQTPWYPAYSAGGYAQSSPPLLPGQEIFGQGGIEEHEAGEYTANEGAATSAETSGYDGATANGQGNEYSTEGGAPQTAGEKVGAVDITVIGGVHVSSISGAPLQSSLSSHVTNMDGSPAVEVTDEMGRTDAYVGPTNPSSDSNLFGVWTGLSPKSHDLPVRVHGRDSALDSFALAWHVFASRSKNGYNDREGNALFYERLRKALYTGTIRHDLDAEEFGVAVKLKTEYENTNGRSFFKAFFEDKAVTVGINSVLRFKAASAVNTEELRSQAQTYKLQPALRGELQRTLAEPANREWVRTFTQMWPKRARVHSAAPTEFFTRYGIQTTQEALSMLKAAGAETSALYAILQQGVVSARRASELSVRVFASVAPMLEQPGRLYYDVPGIGDVSLPPVTTQYSRKRKAPFNETDAVVEAVLENVIARLL